MCDENDDRGRGGAADIFVSLAMFAIESIFAEQKKAMEIASDGDGVLFHFF